MLRVEDLLPLGARRGPSSPRAAARIQRRRDVLQDTRITEMTEFRRMVIQRTQVRTQECSLATPCSCWDHEKCNKRCWLDLSHNGYNCTEHACYHHWTCLSGDGRACLPGSRIKMTFYQWAIQSPYYKLRDRARKSLADKEAKEAPSQPADLPSAGPAAELPVTPAHVKGPPAPPAREPPSPRASDGVPQCGHSCTLHCTEELRTMHGACGSYCFMDRDHFGCEEGVHA